MPELLVAAGLVISNAVAFYRVATRKKRKRPKAKTATKTQKPASKE